MKWAMKSTSRSDGRGSGGQSPASSPGWEIRGFQEEGRPHSELSGEVGINHTGGGGEEDFGWKKVTGGRAGWAEGRSHTGVQHHVR